MAECGFEKGDFEGGLSFGEWQPGSCWLKTGSGDGQGRDGGGSGGEVGKGLV